MSVPKSYYRDLPPIPEDERGDVQIPAKLSMSFMQVFSHCPRSAFLDLKHGGGASSTPMIRGSLAHEVFEELTNMMILNDEPLMETDVAKEVVSAVLADHPEWVLPPSEVDHVRMMAYNWTRAFKFDISEVFGVEQMWTLTLPNGIVIRGKLDMLLIGNGMAKIRDYKTALSMMSQSDWEEDFQRGCYEVIVAKGETDDGQKLPQGIQMFESDVIYPRYVFDDRLGTRTAYSDMLQVQEFYEYLIDLTNKIVHAFETWKFPALPSEKYCNQCTARAECPLAENLRDGAQPIESYEEAAEAAEDRLFHQASSKRLSGKLRKWIEDYGPVQYGSGREMAIVPDEKNRTDWDSLVPAIEASVETGVPFDRDAHIKHTVGTRIADRKIEKE
jgi:hypothetical protein